MMRGAGILSLMLAGAMLLSAGCGGTKTSGTPAPAGTAAVPLSAVLESPGQYDGKVVVLNGVITGQCPSLCDFTYTEGGSSVTIYMGEEKAPKVKPGQPVRVTAMVYMGEEKVVLTAKGLELLPRKGES